MKLLCLMQVECGQLGTQTTFRENFKLLHMSYPQLENDLSNVIQILEAACHVDPGRRSSPEGLLTNANVLALKAAYNL